MSDDDSSDDDYFESLLNDDEDDNEEDDIMLFFMLEAYTSEITSDVKRRLSFYVRDEFELNLRSNSILALESESSSFNNSPLVHRK